MVDTPSKPFPAVKPTRFALAHIDPDGKVSATWRTWCILGGALVWCTMLYSEFRGVSQTVSALSIEVQAHREILIKQGFLDPTATAKKAP